MKSIIVLLLCLAFALATISTEEVRELRQWMKFKSTFGKSYTHEEERHRFSVFKANLLLIDAMNLKDMHATYGVTKFADLTPAEFKQLYLMNVTLNKPIASVSNVHITPKLPTSFDWSSKGDITPVKNQGQCGSCWDFSATETIESVCHLAGYPLTQLSEQQILDCDTSDYGCNGGWPYNAYAYVIQAGGIETEADYPYTAQDGTCQFNPSDIVCKPVKWQYVTQSEDENAMQNFLYSTSPMSVCVDAETWQFYTGGVISQSSGCGTSIDHCVQVTGWQQMQGMTVWNVRNSWGTDWGVSGYLYVQLGYDVCAIAQVVTVPCVTSKTTGQVVC